MGLGPSVCEKCQVLASRKQLDNGRYIWYCKFCGNENPQDYAGFGDWTIYKDNELFLRFMTGIKNE